jgi:peptide/nickel transport system permease protein
MGRYFLSALSARDVYPIMAWLMVSSLMVVLFNLVADLLYGWLDPRIRYD